MHAAALILTALAGSAIAQTTSAAASTPSSTSGCGTQIDSIIAACLSSTGLQLSACAVNDWDCMCTQQTNVLTCYNNCPSDPARSAAESQQVSWCNAAKAYGTTTSSAMMSATSSSSGMSQTGSASGTEGSSSPSGTTNDASQSSSSNSPTPMSTDNAATSNVIPSALVAFLGLFALL